MFDSLSEKLQAVFKNLRGYGKLTEKNVADALREVRLALLEADVNYKVAKDFVERTRQRALGQEVLGSVTPGKQIIKIVYDESVALMGGDDHTARTPVHQPGTRNWMMIGLHGGGKTTTCGKLAKWMAKQGRQPTHAAGDITGLRRLIRSRLWANNFKFRCCAMRNERDVVAIARTRQAQALRR